MSNVVLISTVQQSDVYSFHILKNIYLSEPTLSCGVWNLVLWPGMGPGPLDLQRGVLAYGPPGKSLFFIFFSYRLSQGTE